MKWAWAWVLGCVLMGPGLSEAASSRTQYVGVVNLNEATAAELDLLPGVGEKAAQRILEHRKKRPFGRVEELVRVKGFGKKKFLKLRAHLALSGPTTLKVEKVPVPPSPGREGPATNP
ncbi:helix-hairpin-helix domain-containing protein [Corallococcus sp. ZKHCc1 1396]|uniref:Helix-hairpin-helix domain-containing protein n=2 Tax=Myxococcaceae TaxID=31 RepID=A0ABR9PS28_9BACT|nr:helix-hairpin-helix domain-containing protein [Corallococcus sp. BB11-1]MBE4750740.1 helix-hairpin-helix domain-containing protein [Corallococcus soli]MCY1031851.1 helix-hairpin-helix domain-containing protein [Corallococcus sp. BB11-1]